MAANWHCSNYREVMKIIWMTIQNLARTHRLPRRRTRGRRTRSRGRTTHPPGPTWPAAPSPSASCSLGILCAERTREDQQLPRGKSLMGWALNAILGPVDKGPSMSLARPLSQGLAGWDESESERRRMKRRLRRRRRRMNLCSPQCSGEHWDRLASLGHAWLPEPLVAHLFWRLEGSGKKTFNYGVNEREECSVYVRERPDVCKDFGNGDFKIAGKFMRIFDHSGGINYSLAKCTKNNAPGYSPFLSLSLCELSSSCFKRPNDLYLNKPGT